MYTQVPGVSHAYVKRNDPNNLIDLVSPGGSPSNPVSRGTDVYAFLDDVSSSNKDTMDQALKIMKSMAPEASNSTELQRGVPFVKLLALRKYNLNFTVMSPNSASLSSNPVCFQRAQVFVQQRLFPSRDKAGSSKAAFPSNKLTSKSVIQCTVTSSV